VGKRSDRAPVTHLGLEETHQSGFIRTTIRVANIVVPPLRWLVKRLPWIDGRIGNTLGGRFGTVSRLLEKKQFAEAFRLSADALSRCEAGEPFVALPGSTVFKQMGEALWWPLFQALAQSAGELGDEERAETLARLGRAPEPGGVYEARCLDTFSRWRWAAKDPDGAIDFSRRAVLADQTWPYGHITLAWYGLVTGKFDPLPSLREAVRISPEALPHIRAIREFEAVPGLLAAVEESARPH